MISGETVIQWVQELPRFTILISFFAPFFGGELTVIGVAFFAGTGVFSLWQVIIGSFFGMMALDIFWFMVPNSRLANRLKNWGKSFDKYRALEQKIESISQKSDILILLFSKIMVGTRILIITYLGLRKISLERFVVYNGIATFIWAIMLGLIGYFAGRGHFTIASAYQNITVTGVYIGGIVIILYGIQKLIRYLILKK